MGKQKLTVLFDGVCNLCNRSVDFILKRDKKKQFEYVSLQSKKGQELVSKFNIPKETDSVILIKEGKVFTESDAAIEITRMFSPPWKWLAAFRWVPKKLRDRLYRWIARNRYRWFGKRETCRIIEN